MRIATHIVLVVGLALALGKSQGANRQSALGEKTAFATNRCLSKGGLGIVNSDLYIVVKSPKNELLFGRKEHWSGLKAENREVMVFYDNNVLEPQKLPKDFDLSKSVIISFEGDKIRFFNFQNMSGCYYARISE